MQCLYVKTHNRYTKLHIGDNVSIMPHYDSPDLRPLSVLLSDLGKQIEAYRISRNLKQAELAEMAGISRSTLARLEAGNGGTIDSLARIMRALERSEEHTSEIQSLMRN